MVRQCGRFNSTVVTRHPLGTLDELLAARDILNKKLGESDALSAETVKARF